MFESKEGMLKNTEFDGGMRRMEITNVKMKKMAIFVFFNNGVPLAYICLELVNIQVVSDHK